MSRSIFDLDSVVEHLSIEDPSEIIDEPFEPDKRRDASRELFDKLLCESGLLRTDLEDAAISMAVNSELAGFSRGFKAGARLVLQMLQQGGIHE